MWNRVELNSKGPHWWKVNTGSGNGLVPSGNKNYVSQCWSRSMSLYGVSEAQGVNRSVINPHNISKPRDSVYTFPIALEFDMHFGSSTAEMLVKFQSGTIIMTFNIADSGLHEIWRQSRVEGGYYTDVCNDGKGVRYTASCDNQWIIETRKAKFLSMFFHVNLHWKSHMSAVWVATDCIPEHVMHYKSEIMDS